ncbi:MAG: thiamine pyrophosphate-binding protein [Lachnospiraceae bacterium]|nr:thiamine pyrophosphate-binding protein [Lachnospiraceae bacterium]
MKKRVADIIIETLLELGINDCFCVVGGGAMHIDNALKVHDKMKVTFCHHEQACAFAAEGYAKYSGKIALVSVTSGPGGVNTLNGVYSAWVDSAPMFVIAGHPRSDTTVEATGLNLRCRGVQEFDIISSIKNMTKYSKMILDAREIKREIIKAYNIAMSGRRGPVWLSVPLDIQSATVDEDELFEYQHSEYDIFSDFDTKEVIDKIKNAKSPCILTGSAIRYADAYDEFIEFIHKIKIPVIGAALLPDILPEDYPLYYGLSGNIGPRTGNYILQNADLILVLGNSLSVRQTGFDATKFAPDAYFIMVDAEKDEMKKPDLHIDFAVHTDIKTFFNALNDYIKDEIKAPDKWVEFCDNTYKILKDIDDPNVDEKSRIPAKYFWKVFRKKIEDDAIIALGNSNCVTGLYQYGVDKLKQRVITNANAGSMGYDLPEAVGVSIVSDVPVYCVTGDGSIMMNLQELETISYNNLDIKIVIFSNDGYGAIRQTCKNYFNGDIFGCDDKSGVGLPDFEKVAYAFDFGYMCCNTNSELDECLDDFINSKGRTILEIKQLLDDPVVPKLMSKMNEDGVFEAPQFTSFYPFLDDETEEKLIYK